MNPVERLEYSIKKREHKYLKDVYTGKKQAVVLKKKGLRKDSPQRQFLEFTLNRLYLKNYGKMKKAMLDLILYGQCKINIKGDK